MSQKTVEQDEYLTIVINDKIDEHVGFKIEKMRKLKLLENIFIMIFQQ